MNDLGIGWGVEIHRYRLRSQKPTFILVTILISIDSISTVIVTIAVTIYTLYSESQQEEVKNKSSCDTKRRRVCNVSHLSWTKDL